MRDTYTLHAVEKIFLKCTRSMKLDSQTLFRSITDRSPEDIKFVRFEFLLLVQQLSTLSFNACEIF